MIRNWRIAYCPTLKGKVWNDLTKKCLQNIFTENKNLTEHSLTLHGYWIINWSFVHRWVIQTRVSLLLLIKLTISLFYQWSIPLFYQWFHTFRSMIQYMYPLNCSLPPHTNSSRTLLSIVPYFCFVNGSIPHLSMITCMYPG